MYYEIMYFGTSTTYTNIMVTENERYFRTALEARKKNM